MMKLLRFKEKARKKFPENNFWTKLEKLWLQSYKLLLQNGSKPIKMKKDIWESISLQNCLHNYGEDLR